MMALIYWLFIALVVVIGVFAMIICRDSMSECSNLTKNGTTFGVFLITIGLCMLIFWFGTSTESGKRAFKDQQSNFNHGIERTILIYDFKGQLIRSYTGKFDVEVGNRDRAPYILFDDNDGKRHIVFYTTGTIIIDEK